MQDVAGVAQNQLYWHHSSLKKGPAENLTRGAQRYRFKAGNYESNPNHNKSNLLVSSLLTKAFKMAALDNWKKQTADQQTGFVLNFQEGNSFVVRLKSQGLISPLWWPYQETVQTQIRHTSQKWAIELIPIYRRFDLILLVLLLKLNEVIQCILGCRMSRDNFAQRNSFEPEM